jgi:hypothetical protein
MVIAFNVKCRAEGDNGVRGERVCMRVFAEEGCDRMQHLLPSLL